MTNWWNNTIFYELYLRAFQDGNSDGHGDFAGMRQRLDYLEWLGIDCIWLLPINASPLKDDGYDVASYYTIHPTYGSVEDFQMTLDEVHRRGLRLITDMVMNHTSDQHPWFRESRRSKDSPMRDFYVWSETPDRYKDARIIFVDTEQSNWAYDGSSSEYYWHRFYSSQPDLNYDNPAVKKAMLDAVRFWMDMGVDGFRLDAVPYLIEREGTNCENLPETHAFLKELRSYVDQRYPGRLLLAEANQWPWDLMPYFGDGDGDELHVCFHFPIMPRLYMALARKDKAAVIDILDKTPDIPANCQWATFLRNHDELTLEMVTPDEREFMWNHYAPDFRQRLNLGIRRRLSSLLDHDQRKIELMNSLLFTLPGVPVLYYGDEIGMSDNVMLPDRNGVRTPMQWHDDVNAGFSSAPPDALYSSPLRNPAYGFQQINVNDQMRDPASLLNHVRRMIYTRKTLPLLSKSPLKWLETSADIMAFERYEGGQRLVAVHNLSDEEREVTLDKAGDLTDALNPGQKAPDRVELPPYGYRWFVQDAADVDALMDKPLPRIVEGG